MHPGVVGGDMVGAVGDEEEFGGGDGCGHVSEKADGYGEGMGTCVFVESHCDGLPLGEVRWC